MIILLTETSNTALYVTIVTAIASVIASIIGYYSKKLEFQKKLKRIEKDKGLLEKETTAFKKAVIPDNSEIVAKFIKEKAKEIDLIFENTRIRTKIPNLRCLILEGKNGSALPTVDTSYKVSVLATDKESTDAIGNYHDLKVDEEYRKMLAIAATTSQVMLDVEEMPKCVLHSIYDLEGVKHSCVYYITIFGGSMLYGSFAMYEKHDDFHSDKMIQRLAIGVRQLQNLWNDFYEELKLEG